MGHLWENIDIKDTNFLSLFYRYGSSILFETMINPDMLKFIDRSRRIACERSIELIQEKTSIEIKPFSVREDFKYYMDCGKSLLRIGELKKSLHCFKKASKYSMTPAGRKTVTEQEKTEIHYCYGLVYYDFALFKKTTINLEMYLENKKDIEYSKQINCKRILVLAYAHLSEIIKSKQIYKEYKSQFSERERIEIKAHICYYSGNYLESIENFKKIEKWSKYFNFMDRIFFPYFLNYRIARDRHSMLKWNAYSKLGYRTYAYDNLESLYMLIGSIVNKNHPIFGQIHNDFAEYLIAAKRYDMAWKYLKVAEKNIKLNYGDEPWNSVHNLILFGLLHLRKYEIEDSKKYLDIVEGMRDKYGGYFESLTSIYMLRAAIFRKSNLFAEARDVYKEVIEKVKKRHGSTCFKIAFCYQSIAKTYMNDLVSMNKCYRKSFKILYKISRTHPEVYRSGFKYVLLLLEARAKEIAVKLAKTFEEELEKVIADPNSHSRLGFLKCYHSGFNQIQRKIEQFIES